MICDNKNKKELNKEAPLMMNTMEIAKKIIISSEEHGEFDWTFLQILQDFPWKQDSILLVFYLLDLCFDWKSFLWIQQQFSQQLQSSVQRNLFIHNIIFNNKLFQQ